MEIFAEKLDPCREILNKNSNIFFSMIELEGTKNIITVQNNIVVTENYNHVDKMNSFPRWTSSAITPEKDNVYNFKKVATRLSKKKLENRKNADLREFRFWSNYFLVKRFFTHGLLTVPENLYHVYTTVEKNLDFYYATEKIEQPDCFFCPKMEYKFVKFVLESNRTLVIPPGTQYIMIAPSTALFYWIVMNHHPFVKNELLQ